LPSTAAWASTGAGLLIGDRQQVHGLPAAAGMAGAPHRLAVHGQCPPLPVAVLWPLVTGCQPPGEPGTHRRAERIGIDSFQDPADGGLIRRLEPARQGIMPDPERGQNLRRRVRDPLADRGQRLRPGQHRGHRRQ
jgi:hypothetical protein